MGWNQNKNAKDGMVIQYQNRYSCSRNKLRNKLKYNKLELKLID